MDNVLNLKRCPFCGGKARFTLQQPYDGYQGEKTTYKVKCEECGASISSDTPPEAIDKWNARNIGTTLLAENDSAPPRGTISEIMCHYKSPLVTINFQEMEENPC